MRTLREESSIALRQAVKNGVVDTVLLPFQFPAVRALLSSTRERVKLHRQNPDTFELYEHPKSTQWHANSLPERTHPDLSRPACIEVARFVVPKGQVGFVKYIEQSVHDYQGRYYPTNQEYWGSPGFVISDVANIRWWLKLDFFNGVVPDQFFYNQNTNFGSEVAPGMPYSPMATIEGLWYPAHLCRELKLVVPGNRMLRMYYYSPATSNYGWVVRGRLSGYLQTTHSDEAMQNARRL
jgi:hypothetical protein